MIDPPAELPNVTMSFVSSVTLGELAAGVHTARTATERAGRLSRLQALENTIETLPFGGAAARAYGELYALVADIAVAAAHTTFACPEVRLDVVPAVISVTVLPRLLPRAAHELFLTGETFDATRAVAIGLVNSAVPADQLDAEVDRYTGMLVKGGPQALALTKQLLRRGSEPTRAHDFATMLELSTARFTSAEDQ